MNRTLAERRHHRERVIRNRVGIIRQAWGRDDLGWKPGQLDKGNLVCSCPMCRAQKYRDTHRQKFKHALRREAEGEA